MAKVDGKATITHLYNRRLSRLICNQQGQKLPRLSKEYLAWLIVFVSTGAVWLAIGDGIAIAANPGTCQTKDKISPLLLPIEQTNNLSCVATKRSPINLEIAQIASQDKNFELSRQLQAGYVPSSQSHFYTEKPLPVYQTDFEQLRQLRLIKEKTIVRHSRLTKINVDSGAWVADLNQPTLTNAITKVHSAEALTPDPNRQYGIANLRAPTHVAEDSSSLLPLEVMPPYRSANVKVVPFFEPKTHTAENLRNTQQSNSEPQLKVHYTNFPLLSPQAHPALRVERLNAPFSDSDAELGTLRVRELELQPRQAQGDAELGTLRVRELELQPRQAQGDAELGTLHLRKLEVQPLQTNSNLELGNLRLREQELQLLQEVQSPQTKTTVRLLGQVGYFQTNNIFSGIDPIDDSLFSLGLTLWAAPALGSKTALVTAIDGTLIRYVDQSEFNYNQLRFRAAIRQQLTPRMYGEIGLNNQQLFRAGEGDRFLNENSLRLAFQRRDQLNKKLRLDTLYEFRFSDANPERRSRIINSLSVSLSYYLKRNLQVGLDYQFALSNFTQRDREDQYHRLLGRLNYAVSDNSQISVQGGLTLGGSSEPNIDFDNFFFSVSYTVELGKF